MGLPGAGDLVPSVFWAYGLYFNLISPGPGVAFQTGCPPSFLQVVGRTISESRLEAKPLASRVKGFR